MPPQGYKAALITMPFAPATRPSIQLGILKALLDRNEIPCQDFYFNVDFLDRLRQQSLLSQYTSSSPSLLSEWYFSEKEWDPSPQGKDFLASLRLKEYAHSLRVNLQDLLSIKTKIVPEYLQSLLEAEDWSQFAVAAFTMSFPQICSSFALARRLKERFPGVRTVFGGASSQIHPESCAEFMRIFPFIDAMVVGEAEPVFPDLIRKLSGGGDCHDLPGIFWRKNAEVVYNNGASVLEDLNDSPLPDYSTFFEKYRKAEMGLKAHLIQSIPMEMARGCPWGQKNPCTFCAFAFHGKFRKKSSERVVTEILEQSTRYHCGGFYVVDDAVTPPQIDQIFPKLRPRNKVIYFPFLEMRTNVARKQMEILSEAGVKLIQPGIECLSDGLLKKIHKGTTVFQNILFMKWCRELQIRLSYNIILGIPDATREDLLTQLEVMRLIPHLDPPYPMPLSLVRFSQYFHKRDQYNLKNFRPDDFYHSIFPEGTDLWKVAYTFLADSGFEDLLPIYQETVAYIQQWQLWWSRLELPYLRYREAPGGGVVEDWRIPTREAVTYPLTKLEAALYSCCIDRALDLERISEAVASRFPESTPEEIRAILADFSEKRLSLSHDGKHLSLAVMARSQDPAP